MIKKLVLITFVLAFGTGLSCKKEGCSVDDAVKALFEDVEFDHVPDLVGAVAPANIRPVLGKLPAKTAGEPLTGLANLQYLLADFAVETVSMQSNLMIFNELVAKIRKEYTSGEALYLDGKLKFQITEEMLDRSRQSEIAIMGHPSEESESDPDKVGYEISVDAACYRESPSEYLSNKLVNIYRLAPISEEDLKPLLRDCAPTNISYSYIMWSDDKKRIRSGRFSVTGIHEQYALGNLFLESEQNYNIDTKEFNILKTIVKEGDIRLVSRMKMTPCAVEEDGCVNIEAETEDDHGSSIIKNVMNARVSRNGGDLKTIVTGLPEGTLVLDQSFDENGNEVGKVDE